MATSHSGLMTYERCPKQYEYRYILKIPDTRPKSDAMARGSTIHESLEHFLLGKQDFVHHEVMKHGARYRAIRDTCTVWPERKFAFDEKWSEVDFDSEDAWIRGVIDLVYKDQHDTVYVHEFKTGREYPEHGGQKALYGLVALLLFPQQEVEVTGVYLDLNKDVKSTFSKSLVMAYKDMWEKRFAKVKLPIYNTSPGRHCNWCAYSKKCAGPCQF